MRLSTDSLFVRFYALCACLGIGLGGVILSGGEARFSGPSFKGPTALVAWAPLPAHWIWGVFFLAYGLILVGTLGRPAAVHVLRVGIILYTFLAISFIGSVTFDPRASLTGFVAYLGFAVAHLYLSDHLHARGWER